MKNTSLFILVLSFSLNVAAQNEFLVISNTNVIDVRHGKVVRNVSVVIKDSLIYEVTDRKNLKLPAGTTIIDGTSRYVLPGMADAHIHFSQSGGLYTRPDAMDFTHVIPYETERRFTFDNTTDYFRRYLRLGITTVADVGGPFSNFVIRDSIGKAVLSPRVLVTGPLFSMVEDKPLELNDPVIIKTTTTEAADSLLNKMLPYKPDYIKIWYIVTPELPAEKTFPVIQHIARRTHDAKLKLAVHATELRTAELALEAGADILVHSVDDAVLPDSFIKKMLQSKVSYIPTLTVVDGYITTMTGKLKHRMNDLRYANPFVYGSLMDPEHLDKLPSNFKMLRERPAPPSIQRQDSIMAVNLKKVYTGGVNVVAGTDAGNVGTMHASSFIAELKMMEAAGLSRAEVLKTATLNAASCFKLNNGAAEKGKTADLIVLKENPLENLENLSSVEYVILEGKALKADTLIAETSEMLVQRQLNAYNARNLEAFLDTYADDVALYNFPEQLISKGKEQMRKTYGDMFSKLNYLHCEIVDRIKLGNTIVDHERVKFNDEIVNAIAIYEVKNGKIVKVTFKN